MADFFHQLRVKQQKIDLLEFEAQKQKSTSNLQLSEHKENNKKLHKEVITLQTDINERDDCHHKVQMARNLPQMEVDDLNKKNKNLKKDKDELIQQQKEVGGRC